MIRRCASLSSVFYLHRGVERDLDLERILQPATFVTMFGNPEKLGSCQAEWYYKFHFFWKLFMQQIISKFRNA